MGIFQKKKSNSSITYKTSQKVVPVIVNTAPAGSELPLTRFHGRAWLADSPPRASHTRLYTCLSPPSVWPFRWLCPTCLLHFAACLILPFPPVGCCIAPVVNINMHFIITFRCPTCLLHFAACLILLFPLVSCCIAPVLVKLIKDWRIEVHFFSLHWEMKGHWSHVNLWKARRIEVHFFRLHWEMKGHWSCVNLVRHKALLKDLHATSVLSFPNANKKVYFNPYIYSTAMKNP